MDFLRPRHACASAPNIVPVVSHRADQTLLTSQTVQKAPHNREQLGVAFISSLIHPFCVAGGMHASLPLVQQSRAAGTPSPALPRVRGRLSFLSSGSPVQQELPRYSCFSSSIPLGSHKERCAEIHISLPLIRQPRTAVCMLTGAAYMLL